jgi:hypothetical protein
MNEDYAQRCITLEPLQLQEEFCRVSSDLHHWRAQWVSAMTAESLAINTRKRVWAETYNRLREYKAAMKLTETALESAVETDAEYQKALKAEVEASEEKARIYAVVEAIQIKQSMLISLGSMVRQERDISIREKEQR